MLSRAAARSLAASTLVLAAICSGSLPGPRELAAASTAQSSHYVEITRVGSYANFQEMFADAEMSDVRDIVDDVLPLGWTPATLEMEDVILALDEFYSVSENYDVKYTYRILPDGQVIPVCRSRGVLTVTPQNGGPYFAYRVSFLETIGQ